MTPKGDSGRRSLTGSILNKRLRIVVFHPDDDDGGTLTMHLKRMGFQVQAFWPPLSVLPLKVDLVFRALLAEEREPEDEWSGTDKPPLISIIAYESPTFIDQALKMGSNSIITTPIRASGLLPAIVFALQHAKQTKQQAARIDKLEQKVKGIRQLSEAKEILMQVHSIGENEAYEILRGQAMAKRVTVDEICRSIIQANELLMLSGAHRTPPATE